VGKDIEKESSNLNLQHLMENIVQNDNQRQKLVIADMKGFTVIKVAELIKCEADGYCTHFFLPGKIKVTSSKNLKYYEEILDQQKIIRVHRSFLVNLSHVKGYSHQGEIHLSENISCPLGDSYKQHFLEVFGKNL
jgi:two-component system, LytTR family, response regulator